MNIYFLFVAFLFLVKTVKFFMENRKVSKPLASASEELLLA